MPKYPVERKIPMQFFVNKDEYEVITSEADKEKMTYSEYIRLACLTDACLSGNSKALKITFKNAAKRSRGYLARKYQSVLGGIFDSKKFREE